MKGKRSAGLRLIFEIQLPANMLKLLSLLSLFAFAISCSDPKRMETEVAYTGDYTVYSRFVKDTFVISVQTPDDYLENKTTFYPTVYVLDANFHFPIVASVAKQYERAGILPPLVMVGVGYPSLQKMDSLRTRDYLYPAARPEDEVEASGGGLAFYDFLHKELIPYVDSSYRTDKQNRTLEGHSFGGYFCLYALWRQAEQGPTVFKNFLAASPSVWYHNFYMDTLGIKLKTRMSKDSIALYMTVGGSEDPKWDIGPGKKIADEIKKLAPPNMRLEYTIFSNTGHMDVAAISAVKGLQYFFSEPENNP